MASGIIRAGQTGQSSWALISGVGRQGEKKQLLPAAIEVHQMEVSPGPGPFRTFHSSSKALLWTEKLFCSSSWADL